VGVAHRTYILTSPLTPQEALRRAAALLASEGVRYTTTSLSIVSTTTPFAIAGFQRRLYTRRNWLGINPFTHASAVNLTCERTGDGTSVTLEVDRTRAIGFAVLWVVCGALTVPPLPMVGGVLVMAAVASVAWFHVAVIGGRLIAREIEVAIAHR
jgi:hypothetical protein